MERVIVLLFFCCGASGVRLQAPRQPPVVLDEWDAGPARELFCSWADDPRNQIIFTDRGCEA